MADIVEKVKRLGERYNSSLIRIGSLMEEIARDLEDIPYNSFKVGNLVWKRDCLPRSARWAYGPVFIWEPEGIVNSYGPNESWYHANDFNCHLRTASPKGFRAAARTLPEFLDCLKTKLTEELSESEELEEELEKILSMLEESRKKEKEELEEEMEMTGPSL